MHFTARICVATVLTAGTFTTLPLAGATSTEVHYVALGDSFAAGSGVFPQVDSVVCERSAVDYPSLVAAALHAASFADATCGGATLADLTVSQHGFIAGMARPQLDVLGPDPTLVTITMGANDIDMFSAVVQCLNPLSSCADQATGHDVFAEHVQALGPVYDRALDQIHARAPKATVAVVGYPNAARPGSCPQQPVRPRDMDYLQSVMTKLNGQLRAVAGRHGDTYVDVATSSVGHDMCAAPDKQWINGIVPSLSTPSVAPLHPNSLGEQNMAAQILAAVHR